MNSLEKRTLSVMTIKLSTLYLILSFLLGYIYASFNFDYNESNLFYFLSTMVLIAVIFYWYVCDTDILSIRRTALNNAFIIALAIIFIPVHLFKTRPKNTAVKHTIVFLLLLVLSSGGQYFGSLIPAQISTYETRLEILDGYSNSQTAELIKNQYKVILESGDTPYINVDATIHNVVIPQEYVLNGKITFDLSPSAIDSFSWSDEGFKFVAKFSGKDMEVIIPYTGLEALYSKESGEGMLFDRI